MVLHYYAKSLVKKKKKLALLSQQIRRKTKSSHVSFTHVFPRLESAKCFRFPSFDWLTGLSVPFVIGRSYNFGFGFRTLD